LGDFGQSHEEKRVRTLRNAGVHSYANDLI
jgi:hypothetical protein